jgi:hypothetical protein
MFLTIEENLIAQTKRRISPEFEMKDLEVMHYFWAWRYGRNRERTFSHGVNMKLMCFTDLA